MYYEILNAIKDTLKQDSFVNTVSTGSIYDFDLKKQTMFPLSHIIVNNVNYNSNVFTFNISIIFADVVDISKEEVTDYFIGNDNLHDIHNTQLMVANRFLDLFNRGDIRRDGYELTGTPSLEPFDDRFENGVAGWTLTFDLVVKNEMTIC